MHSKKSHGRSDANTHSAQVYRIRAWSKVLGWTATCRSTVYKPTKSRAQVVLGRRVATDDLLERGRELKAAWFAAACVPKPTPAQQRALSKARRLLAQHRKRYTLKRDLGAWTIDTNPTSDPEASRDDRYENQSTHQAYIIVACAMYKKWEAEWDDLAYESQRGRILAWGKHSGWIVTMKTYPPEGEFSTLFSDHRRWNFWDQHLGKKLHPQCVVRLIGENPDAIGLTTNQVRRLMKNAKLYRGGFDLPETPIAYPRHPLTVMDELIPEELRPAAGVG